MTAPVDIEITNLKQAATLQGRLRAGRHFVFVGPPEKETGRRRRLHVGPSVTDFRVHALAGAPLVLSGVTLKPKGDAPEPLAAVVPDRDLYRAEEDPAHLFVVLPGITEPARLVVECDGQPFTERDLVLENGAALVPLAALMAGRYRAVLEVGGKRLGAAAEFTVAEYGLAPLSAGLVRHEADRAEGTLSFTLSVESWQQPCTESLIVTLLDDDRPVDSTTLRPETPGRYAGTLKMEGDGPFRLEARVETDPGRVAVVAIPGTRKAERELTVVSELGKEVVYSLLPEPSAIPARGGYLAEGDRLTTPFTVESVLTDAPTIEVRTDAAEVHVVVYDLVAGTPTVIRHGAAAAGDRIPVETPSGLALVAVGALVNGEPFEGFTTFLRPGSLDLRVSAPERARPHEEVTVTVETGVEAPVPVLVTVRDRRLTVTDTPSAGLGASFKRGVEAATSGMSDGGIEPLDLVPDLGTDRPFRVRRRARMRGLGLPYRSRSFVDAWDGGRAKPARSAPRVMSLGLDAETLEEIERVEGGASTAAPGVPDVPDALEPRGESPALLFVGLLQIEGKADVEVWTGDGTGSFVIEVFACHGGDWQARSKELVVDQTVRADLELPPTARVGDDVTGRLRVAAASGRARVALTRDGVEMELRGDGGTGSTGRVAAPARFAFDVVPGVYVAKVEDDETGEIDAVELEVREPGTLRTHARELILLTEGEAICLEDAGALSLRVLPGLDEPFDLLVEATADYSHLCCEQTAAKILSAVAMYLAGGDDERRAKAESIIRKGVAREEKMFRSREGFRMYPQRSAVSDYYSSLAVRYLWNLQDLRGAPDLSPGLRKAVSRGLEMADDAGRFHRLEKAPKKPKSLEDAYAAITRGGNERRALATIDKVVEFRGDEVALGNGTHAVADRAGLAWAAAGLLAAGDLARGVRAANAVVRQFGEDGRLYSTVDSAAAIALMIQLRKSGIGGGEGGVRVNGEEVDLAQAVSMSDTVESVECRRGTVAVQALSLREERWEEYGAGFGVRVGLREDGDRRAGALRPGQRVDLVVRLADGYRVGDLAHVDLPACLSWLKGGGLVKRFSVDFEGADEVRIPLAVTGHALGGQHFATCVRNMFEEERKANPGLVKVVTDVA